MLKRTLFVTLVLTFLGTATYFIVGNSSQTRDNNPLISHTKTPPNSNQHTENGRLSNTTTLMPAATSQSAYPAQASLWAEDNITKASAADITFETHMEPTVLKQFHVGQTLSFTLPATTEPLEATINTTHNQGMNVKVWKASSVNTPEGGVIITQGKIETHIVIMTQSEVYTAIADNVTGKTVVINQADKAAHTIPYEDGIALPTENEPLPVL